jgi:riboflavin synthase
MSKQLLFYSLIHFKFYELTIFTIKGKINLTEMFTGIIESLGKLRSVSKNDSNVTFNIESEIATELKVDQSVSHNGVCLTVESVSENSYTVTAINETLEVTNLGKLKPGDIINLERSMKLNGRLDGHIVQGHIDQTGKCTFIKNQNGSWIFGFSYDVNKKNITIEKGSITVNGVSLTVLKSNENSFSVAIIPYTYENTNFNKFIKGEIVNLEFDVLGKYMSKLIKIYL